MSHQVFRCTFTVRFGDCDPAGIVFYPRYVEMLNNACEEWFEKGLAEPWGRMHRADHRGMPIVDLQVRFLKPSRLGEHLDFALTLTSLRAQRRHPRDPGRRENGRGRGAEAKVERRLEAQLKLVHSDLRGPKAIPIPPELRERMKPFLKDAS